MDQIKKDALTAAGVDVDGALRRFSNMDAMYEKFLLRVPEDTTLEKLKSTVQRQDRKGAFMAAHTLKGMAGNLGLQALYDASSKLTEDLRPPEAAVANFVPDYVAVLKAHRAVCAVLKEHWGV